MDLLAAFADLMERPSAWGVWSIGLFAMFLSGRKGRRKAAYAVLLARWNAALILIVLDCGEWVTGRDEILGVSASLR